MKPSFQNEDRWIQYDFHGKSIALWNIEYDHERINNRRTEGVYSQAYIAYHKVMKIQYGNNVVLNFYVEDLEAERNRLLNLKIGPVSEIMFINTAMPYYFFTIKDPDDNEIEITGEIYSERNYKV